MQTFFVVVAAAVFGVSLYQNNGMNNDTRREFNNRNYTRESFIKCD